MYPAAWLCNRTDAKIRLLTRMLGIVVGGLFLGPPTVGAQSWLFAPAPVSGHQVTAETIDPADVLARVQLLHAQLESIRIEIGKPKDSRRADLATNALSHEVHFQALTLYIKADRLALELTGSTGLQPSAVPFEEMGPYHTWLLVNAAYHRLLAIREELKIPESFTEHTYPVTTNPTEVGRAIVQGNRQLNLMLERRFSPSEVFQQVEAARRYAQALLKGLGKGESSVFLPPFQRGKAPADVFVQLIRCFERLKEFASVSGVSILDLDGSAARKAAAEFQIQPGDVYDLATLILSDLAYIHGQKHRAQAVPTVPYPGTKFPSHVFQLAKGLEGQLDELVRLARVDPNWLAQ